MPFARPTLGNRLKAVFNFAMAPISPGYDLENWDREKGFPMPPNPSFSIEDERWRNEHSVQNARQPALQPDAESPVLKLRYATAGGSAR